MKTVLRLTLMGLILIVVLPIALVLAGLERLENAVRRSLGGGSSPRV